jgi:beta-mannosidase
LTVHSAETDPRAAPPRIEPAEHESLAIADGWELAACPPDAHSDPGELAQLDWLPAKVPGTVAGALRDAGRWRPGEGRDLDAEDWWFRTRFRCTPVASDEQVALVLEGLATVCEVFLNGVRLLDSESMFAAHELDVGAVLAAENELAIRCRALTPLLSVRRKPRARWRTKLVEGNLRFFRTMLLGRAPGFAPEPAAVGPWRPVRLIRRHALAVRRLELRPRLDGDRADADGLLEASVLLEPIGGRELQSVELELVGPSGTARETLSLGEQDGLVRASGTARVPGAARWWPHTHGEPALYELTLRIGTSAGPVTLAAGRTGFRTLAAGARDGHDAEADGLDLHVNGVRVFARGAVWTPADIVALATEEATLRTRLELVRDAGMNMVRIPGTGAYESAAFHDLCDELGLLVWQDFMFANLDYPIADAGFRASVEQEARAVLGALAGRPSLAVLCGNSEIEQQVAMLGLDPAIGRGELFGELLPGLVAQAAPEAVYLPSAPCGGTLPFRPDRGVANYYGVGGYRRPLEDARRAEVRFAAECLAFSNVPDEAGVEAVLPGAAGDVVVHHPAWKAGVPRDVGTGWDFEDVRDHYLQSLFGVDPAELRRVDHERYLELSRAVTGEAMAEVFGEWRRGASPCGGGLVLWLADLAPGAGWGVLDDRGRPKPAYHHLKRALAPVAVWMTDEGLGGLRVHVANEGEATLAARLRVALYRDGERRVDEAHEDVLLPAHGSCERDVEAILGHFVDAAWAYRFGPPAHDAVVASLEPASGEAGPLAQAFRFPAGRPLRRQTADELGLSGSLQRGEDGALGLVLRSERLAYGVRVHVPGLAAGEDALTLEPGVARALALRPISADSQDENAASGALTALNLRGRVRIAPPETLT